MRIQIIGVGVVGSAQSYLLSKLGHEVLGIDRNKTAFEYARMSKEPEKEVDITFICTPEASVESVVQTLVDKQIQGLYVIKSTVPSGTTQRLSKKFGIHISHNPEFLREKIAFQDVLHPNVIVIGACCETHSNSLKGLYAPLGCPIMVSQPTVTETVKLTLNSYLSTLISFWNEVDKLAKALDINTEEVANIVKMNPRVSSYGTEFFGSPFGGKCLPKDLDQIIEVCRKNKVDASLFEAIRDFNGRV